MKSYLKFKKKKIVEEKQEEQIDEKVTEEQLDKKINLRYY